MSFIVKRRIDEIGRIVLPADYRYHFNINIKDKVRLTRKDNTILVTKANVNETYSQTVDIFGRIRIPESAMNLYYLKKKR